MHELGDRAVPSSALASLSSWALTTPLSKGSRRHQTAAVLRWAGPCCRGWGLGEVRRSCGWSPTNGVSSHWLQSPQEPLSLSLSLLSVSLCSVSLGLGARAAGICSQAPGLQALSIAVEPRPQETIPPAWSASTFLETPATTSTILSLLPNCFSEQAGCQTHPMRACF